MRKEWQVLAKGTDGNVLQQCPAGHVHLDYGDLSLRFSSDEFLTFAVWVARAAATLSGSPLSGLFESQNRGGFSNN